MKKQFIDNNPENKLRRIKKYINMSLPSLRESYNDEECKADKDEIWGQILAFETIELLLELNELEEAHGNKK